jgi:phosphoribosylaminoimidazolecarboxamide formyltransferase / IMP cyclohydrolase
MTDFAIKRALLSVSDTTGIVELARTLAGHKVEILATSGTQALLAKHGIQAVEVSNYTGMPEMMAGRLKTLHTKLLGGILARQPEDDADCAKQDIPAIDLVVVNLYAFAAAIADPTCTPEKAIQFIDIGGPTLLRAAAKNYHRVTVLTDPADYATVIEELNSNAGVSLATRQQLSLKVFIKTASYDAMIASYFQRLQTAADLPDNFVLSLDKTQALRYGENPHQPAALYVASHVESASGVVSAQLHQGKPLSFNNIVDLDTALSCVKQFVEPACVIVKHAIPCGVAISDNALNAYQLAYATDSTAAFGGIIALNTALTEAVAHKILATQFVEAIIAPSVEPAALTIFATKPNVRVLTTREWGTKLHASLDIKHVEGGFLVQQSDVGVVSAGDLKNVTTRSPSENEFADLIFAWKVAKFVKSNAIVLAKNGQVIGVGTGQTSRIASVELAASKAQQARFDLTNAVMASDAFFPFRDGIDIAAKLNVTAIIQPGGSLRDADVITAANERQIAMVFTGMRHFRH